MAVALAVGLPELEQECRLAARARLKGRELVARLRFSLQFGVQDCGEVLELMHKGRWLRGAFGEVRACPRCPCCCCCRCGCGGGAVVSPTGALV
jgi:hypothetical protein